MRFSALFCVLAIVAIPVLSTAQTQVPENAEQIKLSYSPIVKKASPAVVNIYTRRKVVNANPLLNDPLFGQFAWFRRYRPS